MQVTLYTLPNCPICNMVKTKLHAKNIEYTETDFSHIADALQTDHAPVMAIDEGAAITFLQSPKQMVDWINTQE